MPKLSAIPVYLGLSLGNALFFRLVFTVNMVYQVTTVGLDPLQLVLVGTTLELSVFLFEIPTGVVADIYSRRLSIIIGIVLIGLGFLTEGLIPTFAAILLAQILWGVGYTFTSGATEAWIVDEVGEANLGNLFIRASQLGQIGSIVGIILSVVLASILINLPIVLAGGLFVFMALCLALFMPETQFKSARENNRSTFSSMMSTFREGLGVIRGRQVLMMVGGIGLIYGLYSEGYDRLWTPHFLDNIGLPEIGSLEPVVWFGVFGIVGMLIGIVVQEVLRRRVDTNDHQRTIRTLIMISAAMIASLAVFALANSFALALVAMLAFNLSRSLTDPILSAWMNRHIPSKTRATILSTFGQIDAFGQIGGGPMIGFVGQQAGIRAALMLSAVILTPVLPLYARLLGRPVEVVEEAAV